MVIAPRTGSGRPSASCSTCGSRSASAWTGRRPPCAPTASQIDKTIRPGSREDSSSAESAPEHLDDLYGAMKDQGSTAKTIRNHHAIISSALHQGVRWGWVRENVAERAKPPRVASAPGEGSVGRVSSSGYRRSGGSRPAVGAAAHAGGSDWNATRRVVRLAVERRRSRTRRIERVSQRGRISRRAGAEVHQDGPVPDR